jgi:hypothetical protein
MENKTKAFISLIIFLIGLFSAIFSPLFHDLKFLIWITLGISFTYLFCGWYLLKGYYPNGKTIVLFLIGYCYSGVFIGSVFSAIKWPFAEFITGMSIFWTVAIIVFMTVLRKKIPQVGLIRFSIEASLMLILSIVNTVLFASKYC